MMRKMMRDDADDDAHHPTMTKAIIDDDARRAGEPRPSLFGRDRERALGLDPRRLERGLQARDLGLRQLAERRPHHGALEAAEEHETLLHAIVHVEEGRRVEGLLQRVEAV